ncbi:MAG TPA: DMT family transporter [Aestuariivirga sp.]|nr:DMT family transporter [Aestuariivirga sp.]
MPVVLLGVFAALCWSIHDLFARSLAARTGPFRMAMLVMLTGFLLLTGLMMGKGSPSFDSSGLLLAAGLGIAYGLGGAGLFKAFSLGPVSLVAPLTAGYPVLVFLWGINHGLEPTLIQWIASAVAIGGAAIVARSRGSGLQSVEKDKLPALLFYCVLASAAYAAAIILGQDAAVAIGEVEATWISRPAAMLTLLPFMVGETRRPPLQLRHWLGLLLIGGLDVLAVMAVIAAGNLPDREIAAIGVSAYGAIAVMLAMIFLKEKASLGQWVGIACIVGGVATLSVSQ